MTKQSTAYEAMYRNQIKHEDNVDSADTLDTKLKEAKIKSVEVSSDDSKVDDKNNIESKELENTEETVENKPVEKNTTKEIEELQKKLETLEKQKKDTQKWGQKERGKYLVAKKKLEEKIQKYKNDLTLDDTEIEELQSVFNSTFDDNEEFLTEEIADSTPFKKVVLKLENIFKEYKRWNKDEELDFKFDSFFKHLDLVRKDKFEDILNFLEEEDEKSALEYVLNTGEDIYNKFYKQVLEVGDAYSYINSLLEKNKKLENNIKKLKEELDDKVTKSYNTTNVTTTSQSTGKTNHAFNAMYGKKY